MLQFKPWLKVCLLACVFSISIRLLASDNSGSSNDLSARTQVASLRTFANRSDFEEAIAGLVKEDFEEGRVLSGEMVEFVPPLNAMTNNAAFSRGEIQNGIELMTNPASNNLILVGRNVWGSPSKCIAVFGMTTTLEVAFSGEVRCVGMDVACFSSHDDVTVEIYAKNDVLISSQTMRTDPGGRFYGVSADVNIFRMELTSDASSVAVDNISFGRFQSGIGSMEPTPAATLLCPYFEVDYVSPFGSGMDTQIYVQNISNNQALAHVMLFTRFGIASENFDLELGPFESETFHLWDVFNGIVPQADCQGGYLLDEIESWFSGGSTILDLIPTCECPIRSITTLRAYHSGYMSPNTGLCGDYSSGNQFARGYLLVDVVNVPHAGWPWEAGYFSNGGIGRASNKNALLGSFSLVDPLNNQAIGNNMVHIQASSSHSALTTEGNYTFYGAYVSGEARDNREPLATKWAVGFSMENPVDSTRFIYWRDTKTITEPLICGASPFWFPLDTAEIFVYQEDGSELTPGSWIPFPRVCDVVEVGGPHLPVPFTSGWMTVDFNSVLGSDPFGETSQGVVMPLYQSNGRFGVGFTGLQLDNASQYNKVKKRGRR